MGNKRGVPRGSRRWKREAQPRDVESGRYVKKVKNTEYASPGETMVTGNDRDGVTDCTLSDFHELESDLHVCVCDPISSCPCGDRSGGEYHITETDDKDTDDELDGPLDGVHALLALSTKPVHCY